MLFDKFQNFITLFFAFEINEISEPVQSVKLQIKGRQLNICGHNINMHIPHTVFCTIPKVLARGICLSIKSFSL